MLIFYCSTISLFYIFYTVIIYDCSNDLTTTGIHILLFMFTQKLFFSAIIEIYPPAQDTLPPLKVNTLYVGFCITIVIKGTASTCMTNTNPLCVHKSGVLHKPPAPYCILIYISLYVPSLICVYPPPPTHLQGTLYYTCTSGSPHPLHPGVSPGPLCSVVANVNAPSTSHMQSRSCLWL